MKLFSTTHRVQVLCALIVVLILVISSCLKILLCYRSMTTANTPCDVFKTYSSRSLQAAPLSDSKMSERQRVAVCFAGNMRTFYYDFVHDTLLTLAIDPLRHTYETDVFFYVRLDDAPPFHKPAQANGPLALDAALKFNPVKVTIVSNGTLDKATELYLASNKGQKLPLSHVAVANELEDMSSRVQFDDEWNMDVLDAPVGCKTKKRIRFPHTLMRSKQCLEMISKYEEQHGIAYDWIYRLRPDTVFLDRIPLPHELSNSVAYTNQANPGASKHSAFMWHQTHNVSKAGDGALNDQLTFSSRGIAERFFRAFDGIEDCDSYHPTISMRPPENTLRLWLMKRGIKYQALPFAWATVHEYTGPTCEKLIYQNVPPDADWKHALRSCYRYGQLVEHAFPESPNWTEKLQKLPRYKRKEDHMSLYYS